MEYLLDYSEYRTTTADPAVEAITTGRDYFTSSLRSQKGRGLPSGVTRWDVLRAVKLARKSLGLSAAVLGYIEFLIEHTFDQDWIGTAAPIVFLAVQSSAQHFGVTPRQINSYERCLANCGLLTWRDASNRRRYGKRRKDGSLLFGFGVDLSPLVERYQDIIAIGEADRLELELWTKSRANVRSYRRVLSAGVVCIRDNGLLSEAAQEAEALIATLPRTFTARWSAASLCDLSLKLEALCKRIKLDLSPLKSDMTSGETEQNFRHYNTENTTENPVGPCNAAKPPKRTSPDGDEINLQKEPAYAGGMDEGSGAKAQSPDSKCSAPQKGHANINYVGANTGIHHVRFEQVMAIASPLMAQMIVDEAGQGRANWSALDRAAATAAGYLGVNASLWSRMRAEIGPAAAALSIVIAERRITDPNNPVNSPGGFVRAMLNRAKTGDLHLHRSVFGLIKRDQSEPAKGLT